MCQARATCPRADDDCRVPPFLLWSNTHGLPAQLRHTALRLPLHALPYVPTTNRRYVGATNTEDDVAILGSKLGLRPDDVGDTLDTATALSLPANFSGMVGLGGNADVFKFQVPTSARVVATLSLLDPFVRWGEAEGRGRSNLDAELALVSGRQRGRPAGVEEQRWPA